MLNPQRESAFRINLSSGLPRLSASIATVTAVIASAWVRLVVAAARGHFMSTKAHAKSYQPRSEFDRASETGRPSPSRNASPFRAAATRSERKLSASAAVLNGFLNLFFPTAHRTLRVIQEAI